MTETLLLQNLIWVLAIGLVGGLVAKLINLPVIIGYMIGGFAAAFLPIDQMAIHGLSEIGLILLLFSVGVELSFERLTRVGYIVVLAASVQIISVSALLSLFTYLLGFDFASALVLATGFSLSSTAVVVKMLEDRGELESIHGRVMFAWLLTQDLFVIPILALLPVLSHGQSDILLTAGQSVATASLVMVIVFFLGKLLAPYIVHTIASTNSRELLVLTSILLATGTAFLVSVFGISAALGAFLAGVVISETQENHAVFAETRPLRDIFVIIFFVTLGFYIEPQVLLANIFLIVSLSLAVFVIKILLVYVILYFSGYKGKTAVASSLGLSQIGEFSFVLFLSAQALGVIDSNIASIGISVTLITLIMAPFVYGQNIRLWRLFKKLGSKHDELKFLIRSAHEHTSIPKPSKKHVIICGYGRVGRWVARALTMVEIPFIVIDYSQKVVHELNLAGTPVIYGDPAEDDIIKNAHPENARAVVIAIPDRTSQEEVIEYCRKNTPEVPVYARANLNSDLAKLSQMQVTKVVQPEFEASLSIVRAIMQRGGKNKKEIRTQLTQLRRLHSISP